MTQKTPEETVNNSEQVTSGEIIPQKVDKPSNNQNEIVAEAVRKAKELLKNSKRMS